MSGPDAYRTWLRLRNRGFTTLIRRSFASFGSHSTIQLPIRLAGERRIAMGSNVFIGSHSWLQVLGVDAPGVPAIVIGDGCTFAGHCVVTAVSEVRFGDAVLLARNVYVSDHSHAYREVGRPVLAQGVDCVAPVRIGDGAWLCQNTVVCPGVTIGAGAVVAANSVVKDDVPDYCVAAGAPARVVRSFAPATASKR